MADMSISLTDLRIVGRSCCRCSHLHKHLIIGPGLSNYKISTLLPMANVRPRTVHSVVAGRSPLSFLHKQKVHSSIGNNNERGGKCCQANNVFPEGKIVKPKGTENTGAWNFDVKTIAVIDEPKLGYFVDDKCFVCVMEDGELKSVLAEIQSQEDRTWYIPLATTPHCPLQRWGRD